MFEEIIFNFHILPCGLKNPVIQNAVGLATKHQLLNCAFRSRSSVNQNPNVLDTQEPRFHILGTRASYILSSASRKAYIPFEINRIQHLTEICNYII